MKDTNALNPMVFTLLVMIAFLGGFTQAQADQEDSIKEHAQGVYRAQGAEKGNFVRSKQTLSPVQHVQTKSPQHAARHQDHPQSTPHPIFAQPIHVRPVQSPHVQAYDTHVRDDQRDNHHDQYRDDHRRTVNVINYVYVPIPAPIVEQEDTDQEVSSISRFINNLPDEAISIYINDTKYVYAEGVFYKQTFSGYEIFDPSTLISGPFSIDIPDNNGGYTKIRFNTVNNGFVGPQGEFYPEFPPVGQLQAMYVQQPI